MFPIKQWRRYPKRNKIQSVTEIHHYIILY